MSVWVKICGNTRLEDAQAAVDAGADALGFVFAPSPRQASAAVAASIVAGLRVSGLRGRVECIGVFVDMPADSIAETVERCGLTGVQLHGSGLHGSGLRVSGLRGSGLRGSGDAGETASLLRTRFGLGLRILRVVHYGPQAAAEMTAIAASASAPDAVLIDTRVGDKVGGTGVAFDWQTAAQTLFAAHDGLRRVAAGGLKPENIAEAIRIMRPWGVDVASGVEAQPGIKDHAKVKEFIRQAKQTDLA